MKPSRWIAAHLRTRNGMLRLLLLAFGVFAAGVVMSRAGSGHPGPLASNTKFPVVLEIGVLVFREGLECILVLAAITAGMTGGRQSHRGYVAFGAGAGFIATLATWDIAIHVINDLSQSIPALALQAATGLLAVVVLLVVMNWFFHKVYWAGWISLHNQRKRALLDGENNQRTTRRGLFWGMGLLGFTSFYREGFEVVLFLQSYRLRLGNEPVLFGVCIGLLFTGIMAALTFVANRHLPYRKMLISTGVLLGLVLLVMVGEQAQEMQLAHWITITKLPWLARVIPPWMGPWLSVFPTMETLTAQATAALLVLGSYVVAGRRMIFRSQSKEFEGSHDGSATLATQELGSRKAMVG